MADKIVLFDGGCKLCSASVQFILKHEKDNQLKFASLQSGIGKEILEKHGFDTKNYNSILFLDGDEIMTQSSAALAVSKHLKKPYSYLRYCRFVPRALRDYVYGFIAKNRYQWFGKEKTCWLPSKIYTDRFLG